MVRFVGVENMVRLIQSIGLEQFLVELAGYIESDFHRWQEFEKSARLAIHNADGVVELMPTSDADFFSFKYVNGHPKNIRHGLQTITAYGVLADMHTGYPRFLSEMTIATALRTAATSAVAAKYLARSDARTMAIIGLGAQSEFQAIGFMALLGVDRLRVYDIDAGATRKFIRNMSSKGFDIVESGSAADAVLGADIITTVTADKTKATILSDNMIGSGVHINAVGGDCPGKTELQAAILDRADVFVEYLAQTRIEGEIQQMPADFSATELWRVISGEVEGRRRSDQITIFDSVGFATEDFSTLRYLYDLVSRTGFFSELDLLADPEDPRDLYGLLTAEVQPIALRSA